MKTLSEHDNHSFMSLRQAVAEMARRIDVALPDLEEPVKMVIAGGVAVNFYCGERVTLDVDASFSKRIMLPDDLVVPYETSEGKKLSVHLDRNCNTTFAVIHEDFEDDAVAVEGSEFNSRNIRVYLLSPVDLAVSKIARFEGPDRDDIAALARAKLIHPEEVVARTLEALAYFVGSTDRVRLNLEDARKIIEDAQREPREQDRRN